MAPVSNFNVTSFRKIRRFSTQASPHRNFSALSPKKKYGRAYCKLQAILKSIQPWFAR
jgi:hypothetical protein